jgi:hypothetical protein
MRGCIECRRARRAPIEGTGDAIGCVMGVGVVVEAVVVAHDERCSCGPPRWGLGRGTNFLTSTLLPVSTRNIVSKFPLFLLCHMKRRSAMR